MKGITRKSQSGRSMIEIIGVLAIMTIMTAGTFALVRSAMANQKQNQIVDDVTSIVTAVRTLFGDQDDLSRMVDDVEGVLDAMAVNTKCPYNDCEYELSVKEDLQTFVVEIENLPARDCIVLLNKNWPDATEVDGECDSPVAANNWMHMYYKK